MINVNKILFWKPEGKREFLRPRCTREGNIKTDLKGLVCENEWIYLTQDIVQWRTILKTLMNLRNL